MIAVRENRTSFMRFFSTLLSITLIVSSLSTQSAGADELSDAKDALIAAQTELAAANAAFSQASKDISSFTSQISTIDPSTTDPELIKRLDELKASLLAAQTNQAASQAKIQKTQQLVDELTVKVRSLEIASQYGTNCPSSWGTTTSDFSAGLELGRFTYSKKVIDKVAAEPRNIVVRADVQVSKDGFNWNQMKTFDYSIYPKLRYSTTMPTFPLAYDAYTLIRFSNAKLRVVTTMAKDGCETLISTTEAVEWKTAVPPTNKMNLDLIYATYLPGISNFQERDSLKALLARTQTDFRTAMDSGFAFKLNDGYIGRSSIFTFPTSGSVCAGDINYLNPAVGQTCSISVYWTSNENWALIDVFSALAKENTAEKEKTAILEELTRLRAAVLSSFKMLDLISRQINAYQNTVNQTEANEESISVNAFGEMKRTLNELGVIRVNFSNAVTNANKYMNLQYATEVRNAASEIQGYTSKYPIDGMESQLSQILSRADKLLSSTTSESASNLRDAQSDLKSWYEIFEREVQAIKGYINAIESQKLVLNTKSAYDSERTKYNSVVEKMNSIERDYQSRVASAMKMAGNSKTSNEKSNWIKTAESFGGVIKLINQLDSYHQYWLASIENSYKKNSDNVVDDDGSEEDPIGAISVVRENSGRFLIRVKTNQQEADILVRATRPGQKTIVFRATTNASGTISIRTSRKLAGWRISLIYEDEILARASV